MSLGRSFERRPVGFYHGGMYDEPYGFGYDSLDGYPGMSSYRLRAHEHLLYEAMYARWSKQDEEAYQCLADVYNKYSRKENEPIFLPPPTYS